MENGLLYILAFSAMAIALLALVLPQAQDLELPYNQASITVYKTGTLTVSENATGKIMHQSTNSSYILNEAVSDLPDGGSIFIAAGTYNIDNSIIVTTPFIEFRGEFRATYLNCTFDGALFNCSASQFRVVGFLKFDNLFLKGYRAVNPNSIGISNSEYAYSDCIVQNSYINGFGIGIQLLGGYYWKIYNNWIEYNTMGVYMHGSSNNLLLGNTISEGYGDGLKLTRDPVNASETAFQITVQGNCIVNNDGCGVNISYAGVDSTFIGNLFSDNGQSATNTSCHIKQYGGGGKLVISGNDFAESSATKYTLSLYTYTGAGITVVTSNRFLETGGTGVIELAGAGAAGAIIEHNQGYP